MTHDVFISYTAQDKKAADTICATLEERRFRCWIAPRDVPSGSSYGAALVDAINNCKVFVLVLSNRANSSTQVMREVAEAVANGIPILPLRIADIQPTDALRYYLKAFPYLDAISPPIEQHMGKLVAAVQALLSTGAE